MVPGLGILPDRDTGGDMRSSGPRVSSPAGLGTDGLTGFKPLPGDGTRGARLPLGPSLIGMDLNMEFNFSAEALDTSSASFSSKLILRRLPWI